MKVLEYAGNVWITNGTPLSLPKLNVNHKTYYLAKDFFKKAYDIVIDNAFLDSSEDSGVVLKVTVRQKLDVSKLWNISDEISIEPKSYFYDDGQPGAAYIEVSIPIDQEMDLI